MSAKTDWYVEISMIAKRLYFEGTFEQPEFMQKTDGLKSPKDWIEFVMNDFKWEPFDARKQKTPGFPLPLPPATDDVTAYNLTELWNGIEAHYLPERGRYVTASRDLQPGELVLREKAFGSIVNHNRTKDVCATCKKYCYPEEASKFHSCDICRSAIWCSEECKERSFPMAAGDGKSSRVAIRDYHLWECHYMKRLQSNFRHYTMALRMVLCNWNQFLKRFIWGERLRDNLYPNEPDEYELITNFESL